MLLSHASAVSTRQNRELHKKRATQSAGKAIRPRGLQCTVVWGAGKRWGPGRVSWPVVCVRRHPLDSADKALATGSRLGRMCRCWRWSKLTTA